MLRLVKEISGNMSFHCYCSF